MRDTTKYIHKNTTTKLLFTKKVRTFFSISIQKVDTYVMLKL